MGEGSSQHRSSCEFIHVENLGTENFGSHNSSLEGAAKRLNTHNSSLEDAMTLKQAPFYSF